MQTLTITQPDDWHLHLRDGDAMQAVLPDTTRRFARAIVMPNLRPPVTTVAQAAAYRERILAAAPAGAVDEGGRARGEGPVKAHPGQRRAPRNPSQFGPATK